MASTGPLVPPSEVADYLKVPQATLTEWRYKGKGPRYFKVGVHVRYRLSDVEKWLEQQQTVPA